MCSACTWAADTRRGADAAGASVGCGDELKVSGQDHPGAAVGDAEAGALVEGGDVEHAVLGEGELAGSELTATYLSR